MPDNNETTETTFYDVEFEEVHTYKVRFSLPTPVPINVLEEDDTWFRQMDENNYWETDALQAITDRRLISLSRTALKNT